MSESTTNLTEVRDVGRLEVIRFAFACGAHSAVHHDLKAALAAGYRDLLAPRYFFVTLGLSFQRTRPRAELGNEGFPLDDDLSGRRVMAGETRVHWSGDIFARDTIVVSQQLTDITRKRGRSGPLELYRYERTYTRDSELLVKEDFVRIAR
jgi:hydroxyacyl-ACP dehydratase HTD2-like protein with hotdog domain